MLFSVCSVVCCVHSLKYSQNLHVLHIHSSNCTFCLISSFSAKLKDWQTDKYTSGNIGNFTLKNRYLLFYSTGACLSSEHKWQRQVWWRIYTLQSLWAPVVSAGQCLGKVLLKQNKKAKMSLESLIWNKCITFIIKHASD